MSAPIARALRRMRSSAVLLESAKTMPLETYVLMELVGPVPGMRRMRRIMAAAWVTGHAIGSLVRVKVMVSSFSPFFWSRKVMLMMSARWSWSGS